MCSTALAIRPDRRIAEVAVRAEPCVAKACYSGACPQLAADTALAAQAEAPSTCVPMDISDTLVADILKPYRPHARYLRSAQITHFRDKAAEGIAANKGLVTAAGRFSIPESCYIDDTGHFNAVEFNICYNQLAYVM